MIDQYNAVSFQFHKGTIKTFTARVAGVGKQAFQFHKGTIKTHNTYI